MKSINTLKVVLIVISSFLLTFLLFSNFKQIKTQLNQQIEISLLSFVLTYFIIGIPIFIGTFLLNKGKNIFEILGLSGNFLKGLLCGLLFAIPMFAGGLMFFKFSNQTDIEKLITGTIVAGFMEELYFRGFLFGQIFRKTKLGFIPSVLLGAVIFALAHLYQSKNFAELTGIFIVTFSGAVFFAWLFVEWNYNLWIAVFTHTFMNLSWFLFDISNNALGDLTSNVFRGFTIALAIIFTIKYKKRRKLKFVIYKETIMINTDEKLNEKVDL